jgi:hypothetical protein
MIFVANKGRNEEVHVTTHTIESTGRSYSIKLHRHEGT